MQVKTQKNPLGKTGIPISSHQNLGKHVQMLCAFRSVNEDKQKVSCVTLVVAEFVSELFSHMRQDRVRGRR